MVEKTGAPWQPVLSDWQRTNEPDRHRRSRSTDILSREWERVWDFTHVVVAEYNVIL
jgi:hypothetical protein